MSFQIIPPTEVLEASLIPVKKRPLRGIMHGPPVSVEAPAGGEASITGGTGIRSDIRMRSQVNFELASLVAHDGTL